MRLFIALNLSEKQKKEIHSLQQKLQGYLEGVKWVGVQGLHLTLKFLGEVEENQIGHIREAMQFAAAAIEPFSCTFSGSGVFPAPHKAKVIWVGLRDGSDAVYRLVSGLDTNLVDKGFAAGARRFSPHLTLGRLRYPLPLEKVNKFLEEERAFLTEPGRVDVLTLYLSRLSRQGAAYTALHEIKFRQI